MFFSEQISGTSRCTRGVCRGPDEVEGLSGTHDGRPAWWATHLCGEQLHLLSQILGIHSVPVGLEVLPQAF